MAHRRVAAIAVLAVAVGFFGVQTYHGARATDVALSRASLDHARSIADRLDCFERRLRDAVEPGTRVALDPALDAAWLFEVYGPDANRADRDLATGALAPDAAAWRMRLPELLFPRARVVDDVNRADLVLSVRSGRGPGSCRGVHLVVRPGPHR